MTEHELENLIMKILSATGEAWMTFPQLDEALYREVKQTWRDEVRRGYLHSALGRMIADGRVERDRYLAKYRISGEELKLFTPSKEESNK